MEDACRPRDDDRAGVRRPPGWHSAGFRRRPAHRSAKAQAGARARRPGLARQHRTLPGRGQPVPDGHQPNECADRGARGEGGRGAVRGRRALLRDPDRRGAARARHVPARRDPRARGFAERAGRRRDKAARDARGLVRASLKNHVPAGSDQSARDASLVVVAHRVREPSPGDDLHQPSGRSAGERDPGTSRGHTEQAERGLGEREGDPRPRRSDHDPAEAPRRREGPLRQARRRGAGGDRRAGRHASRRRREQAERSGPSRSVEGPDR